ncbi:MAG TPA: hypothetical protein VHW47_06550 [Acidimicrobiales bacterium]|jgi:hypothetical protein|nr:hypothetical protein [Acidimicrobiales bacterium]
MPTAARAIRVLEERVNVDAALAEVLVFLADESAGPADPFTAPPEGILEAARRVSLRRSTERRAARLAGALDTAEVVALVGPLNDRRAVDRRRHRGQLLGWRAGARTLHPDWQFDARRGETRTGLPMVLAALAEVRADPEAMDQLMRAPREDLGGRTLADLFGAGQLETVVALVRAAGDQS